MKKLITAQYKIAQARPNPLDTKSNQQAKSIVNKLIPHQQLQGIFRDQYWKPINAIWNAFNTAGLDWQMTGSDYFKNSQDPTQQMPTGKKWLFEINFTNNKGKKTKLYGNVIASGAGTVEDPLSSYDVVAVVG